MDCTECNILTCVLYVTDKCEYFVYFYHVANVELQ